MSSVTENVLQVRKHGRFRIHSVKVKGFPLGFLEFCFFEVGAAIERTSEDQEYEDVGAKPLKTSRWLNNSAASVLDSQRLRDRRIRLDSIRLHLTKEDERNYK